MKDYLIDTHAHLDMGLNDEKPASDLQIEEIIKEAEESGVKKIIIPAVEDKTLHRILEIAKKFPNIYGMVGIFPSEAKTYNEAIQYKMEELAKDLKIVAVGEIGLDYYWDKSFNDIQQKVLIEQIKMANKLELPIVIHDRESHKDCFDILKEHDNRGEVLFHCFSGSVEFMKECVKQGWYIAIGGVVTFKNAVKMKEVAKEVPLDKLVLETDSPYLTPVPYRGKTNRPAYVRYVAEEISKIRGINITELTDITTTNAERFFRI